MRNLTSQTMNNTATNHADSYAEREKEVLKYCSENLRYYKRSGSRNRIDYYLVNSMLIVVSSILPIVILMAPTRQLVQVAAAAVVGILTTINSFYRFRENWIKNINAAHALNIELTKFKGRVGDDYSPDLEPQTALNNLMKHFELISETALTEWRTIVSTAPTSLISAPPRASI